MRKLTTIFAVALAALTFAAHTPAKAQTVATPQQMQSMIAAGQEQEALAQLQIVLQAHPDSAVAWYLTAEAQDASGNEAAARTALANAEQYAPGLPFARPSEVAALQSHINGASAMYGTPMPRHSGISPVLMGVIFLVVVFLILRMLGRRRRYMTPPGYQPGYGPGAPGPYPYGSGPGMGTGIGGSILGGLAAGAGFAAGERIIGDMFGGGSANANPLNPNYGGQNFDPNSAIGPDPDRDDGLLGSPGWDAGSNIPDDSSNFDPGNNW